MKANHLDKYPAFQVYGGSLDNPKLIYHSYTNLESGLDQDGILFANPHDTIITHKPFDQDYLQYLTLLGWQTDKVNYLTQTISPLSNWQQIKKIVQKKNLQYLDTFDQDMVAASLAHKLKLPLNGNPRTSSLYSSKSDFRNLAKSLSLPIVVGFESCYSLQEIYRATITLFNQSSQKVLLKLNQGGGGLGQLLLTQSEFLAKSRSQRIKAIYNFLIANRELKPQHGVVVEHFVEDVVASVGVHVHILPNKTSKFFAMHEIINKNYTILIGHQFPCQNISLNLQKKLKREALHFSNFLEKKNYIGYWAFDVIVTSDEKYYYTEISLRKMGGTRPHVIKNKLFPKQKVAFVTRKVISPYFKQKTFADLKKIFKDQLITRPNQEGIFFFHLANLSQTGELMYICLASDFTKAAALSQIIKTRFKQLFWKKIFHLGN